MVAGYTILMSARKTLRECLEEARIQGVAVGHFNISNVEALHGIASAAQKLGVPVIVAVSEGEEAFLGLEEADALVQVIRERDVFRKRQLCSINNHRIKAGINTFLY